MKSSFADMIKSLNRFKYEINNLLNEFQDQQGVILKENRIIKNEVIESAA
jgi:hypothetical protein